MAKLYVVGIGPGGKEYMTVKAVNVLKNVPVIVGYKYYIELIKEFITGKEVMSTGMRSEIERCKLAVEKVRCGFDTAIISTGDAGLYGMAGPILELAKDIEVEIVPGVTSAFAAAAELGAPIMHDFCCISLSDLMTPWEVIEKRIKLAAQGDFVIAIYNPKSKGREFHLKRAVDIIKNYKKDDTIVGLVKNAEREGQEKIITTLSNINFDFVDMRTLVIIGNKSTFVANGNIVTERGYHILIWIIGGTSEASELAKLLLHKVNFVVSSATYSEREFISQGKLFVGRMDKKAMEEFIKKEHIEMIIDMSHPYALEVTKNAVEVSKEYNLKYIRYVRDKVSDYKDCMYVNSLKECIEFIKTIKGTVFFTTGMKNICDFERAKGSNRFIYRVLPAVASIKECEKQGIKLKDIVAALGPYSEAFNRAMFKEYSADYVIMKDSGVRGGTLEKIEACIKLNIKAVIIGRKEEEGIYKLDELVDIILKSNL